MTEVAMKDWRALADHQCDICGADVEIQTDAAGNSEGYDGDLVKCDDGHTGTFVVTEDEAYCEFDV